MPRNKKYVYICSPKRKVFRPGDWRDAGVVDRAALEMRCTGNCTGGSNPSLSANNKDKTAVSQQLAAVLILYTYKKHIQIVGQSQPHTNASVSWKIKRREDNIVSYHKE